VLSGAGIQYNPPNSLVSKKSIHSVNISHLKFVVIFFVF
jgi:hypothetical protein